MSRRAVMAGVNDHSAQNSLPPGWSKSNPSVSYLELIDQLRDDLQNKLGVRQTPTLLGQENRQDLPVLAPWDTSARPGHKRAS